VPETATKAWSGLPIDERRLAVWREAEKGTAQIEKHAVNLWWR
jgi:hypothetical protein